MIRNAKHKPDEMPKQVIHLTTMFRQSVNDRGEQSDNRDLIRERNESSIHV